MLDEVTPIAIGKSGADILQKVRNERGYNCGSILWESKRTKKWNNGWYTKLKEDKEQAKADFCVLVSKTLPENIKDFGHSSVNDAWVTCTSRSVISGLATALRMGLIEIANERSRTQNRGSKIDDLYNYVTSPDFRERVNAIVHYFDSMKRDLEEEKRQTRARWARQETQIERIVEKTIEMQNVLEAIIGNPMLRIDSLGLSQLTDGTITPIEPTGHSDTPVD